MQTKSHKNGLFRLINGFCLKNMTFSKFHKLVWKIDDFRKMTAAFHGKIPVSLQFLLQCSACNETNWCPHTIIAYNSRWVLFIGKWKKIYCSIINPFNNHVWKCHAFAFKQWVRRYVKNFAFLSAENYYFKNRLKTNFKTLQKYCCVISISNCLIWNDFKETKFFILKNCFSVHS